MVELVLIEGTYRLEIKIGTYLEHYVINRVSRYNFEQRFFMIDNAFSIIIIITFACVYMT